MSKRRIGKLALEDGTVWTGEAFGAEGEAEGELIFDTSMIGYQEALTDPNNHGQMLVMTYTEIGNYGVNSEDAESAKIHPAGLIVRHLSSRGSNFRAEATLEEYMVRFNKVGLQGIDTRALVRKIRDHGSLKAVISTLDEVDDSLVRKARNWTGVAGRNFASQVASEVSYDWDEPLGSWADYRLQLDTTRDESVPDNAPLIIALDFGVRWSLLRLLRSMGYRVRVLPGLTATANEILQAKPAGVLLSNGPGDPTVLTGAVETVRNLLGKVPVMGVCLGNLILGLACGAQVTKLPFGHRGGQSVRDLQTHRVDATHQNHGFTLDRRSCDGTLEITHENVNDGTVAGCRDTTSDAFGVMFFPKLTEVVVAGNIIADESHPMVRFHERIHDRQ